MGNLTGHTGNTGAAVFRNGTYFSSHGAHFETGIETLHNGENVRIVHEIIHGAALQERMPKGYDVLTVYVRNGTNSTKLKVAIDQESRYRATGLQGMGHDIAIGSRRVIRRIAVLRQLGLHVRQGIAVKAHSHQRRAQRNELIVTPWIG